MLVTNLYHPTELIAKATYVTAKVYTKTSIQVTMKSSIFLPYEWWNVVTGVQITDKTRVRTASTKIMSWVRVIRY